MKTVNNISGGKTSFYMALHNPTDINIFSCVCIDYPPASPKDSKVMQYCLDKLDGNFIASAERQLTLRALIDIEQIIGKEIIWVRGKSFDQIIDENSALPTWKRRFCTVEMKLLPTFEYLYPRFGKTIHNIGFRADEYDRIISGAKHSTFRRPISTKNFGNHYQNWHDFDWRESMYPLNRTFHYEIKRFIAKNYPQLIFPWDSNCAGCHHKSAALIKQNYIDDPEILTWFSLQEDKKLRLDKRFVTWHDDRIPYSQIFQTEYPDLFSGISDFTMCNSGGCTD
jgi:hypothetical protein